LVNIELPAKLKGLQLSVAPSAGFCRRQSWPSRMRIIAVIEFSMVGDPG